VVHLLSSVIWLGFLPTEFLLRQAIKNNKGKIGEKKLMSFWLKQINISGMIGSIGILISGILLSIYLGYGFFKFASGTNHWLYTKQFIMILILIIIGTYVIPNAAKLRRAIGEDLEKPGLLSEEAYKNFKNLGKIIFITNFMVLVNFLFAITRRFF
jgi:hypothetical protein